MSVGGIDRWGGPVALLMLAVLAALLVGLLMMSEARYTQLSALNMSVTRAQERASLLSQVVRLVTEAEAAERGLILTGDERFEPRYARARAEALATLSLLDDSYDRSGAPEQEDLIGLARLRELVEERLGQVQAALEAYRAGGAPRAAEEVRTGRGYEAMSALRAQVRALAARESAALERALSQARRDVSTMRVAMAGATALNVLLIAIAGGLIWHNLRRRATQTALLKREVRERTRELAALSSYLQELSEREKKTLARELHDALGGLLVATKMDVAWLRSRLRTDDPAIEQRWERIQRSLDQGVDFKRRVVEDLRPTLLDNMGLFAALRWQFEDTCSRASLEYRERLPQEELPISSEAAIALFRTAQEALTNILKHARATRVFLTVEVDPTHLRMVVGDNGRGIPSPEDATLRGHGLAGMRHRIAALDGQWQVRRRELGGTEVVVEVLLANILLPPEAAPATPPVQPPPETNAIGVAEGDSAPSTGPLPRTG